MSAAGQTINGRIAEICGGPDMKSKRFSVQLVHSITGVVERKGLKAKNINPYLLSSDDINETKRLELVNYCNNALLREAHGRLFDNLIMNARYHMNCVFGTIMNISYENFMNLPRSHNGIVHLNSIIFTYWTTKPSLAGHRCSYAKSTVLDGLVRSLKEVGDAQAKLSKQYPHMPAKDGENCEYIARNFVRFLRCWESERIQGWFWIVRKYPSGTIMVKVPEDDPTDFGDVFLVKGHASVIAELCPRLPCLAATTILPIYNVLTYDGTVMPNPYGPATAIMNRLNDYVQQALDNKTIITQGRSSSNGLWDSVPPELPLLNENESDDNESVNWDEYDVHGNVVNSYKDDTDEEITDEHRKLAQKFANAVEKNGLLKEKDKNGFPCQQLVFRRQGYAEGENLSKMCAVLSQNQMLHGWQFKEKELTYTLTEILEELVYLAERGSIPSLLQPDEKSVVMPLQNLFNEALGEGEITLMWYPPPSEEESRLATYRPDLLRSIGLM